MFKRGLVNKASFESCVELVETNHVGWTLVAARDIKQGTVLLEEEPFISFYLSKNDVTRSSEEKSRLWLIFETITKVFAARTGADIPAHIYESLPASLIKYLDLTDQDKNNLSHFYRPTATESIWSENKLISLVLKVTKEAERRLQQTSFNAEHAANFCLVLYSNAHLTQQTDANQSRNCPKVSLYGCGSKLAHSCNPNAFVRVDPVTGRVSYTLTRDVKVKELLTFSYLPIDSRSFPSLVIGNRNDRRKYLREFKFFDCNCLRCQREEKMSLVQGVDVPVSNSDDGELLARLNSVAANDVRAAASLIRTHENWLKGKDGWEGLFSERISLLFTLDIAPKVFGWGAVMSDIPCACTQAWDWVRATTIFFKSRTDKAFIVWDVWPVIEAAATCKAIIKDKISVPQDIQEIVGDFYAHARIILTQDEDSQYMRDTMQKLTL